jgi:hypothetical protein
MRDSSNRPVTEAASPSPERWTSGVALLFERPEELARLDWGRSHLMFAASATARSLLSKEVAEGWIDCSLLRHPYFAVVSGEDVIPLHEVSSTRVVEGQAYDGFIDGTKLRRYFERGATLSIGAVHEWHAPAKELCRELGTRMAATGSASVFWTAAGAQGLRVHRDDAQVFIIQISGTKRWKLYDTPPSPTAWQPGYVDPSRLPEPTLIDLSPGQALYLPEGLAHSATAQTEPTIHVTLALREPTLRDVMNLAVNACLSSVPKHAKIVGPPVDRERDMRRLVAQFARAIDRLDVESLVASAGRRAANPGSAR